jgi:hypothetical protein
MAGRLVKPAVFVLLVLMLVAGSGALLAGASPAGQSALGSTAPRISTNTDLVAHGTAWVPEARSKFSRWVPKGWGIEAKVKAAGVGDVWVHIPIPDETVANGTVMNLVYVEFCAKSSNGAQTMPTRMDLWAFDTRFKSQAVTWPADNAIHCWGITFSPVTWQQSLGVSVLLHFANTTDQITLYKAWARVQP